MSEINPDPRKSPYFTSAPTKLTSEFGNDLFLISVPGDGSCFFHAVLNAFFIPYRQASEYQQRSKLARQFRKELADYLKSIIEPIEKKRVYDFLCKGSLEAFSKNVPEMSIDNLSRELESGDSTNYVHQEIVSDVVRKDIYVLKAPTSNGKVSPYIFDMMDTLYKNRSSIIIYHESDHYSLVVRRRSEFDLQSSFSPTDPVIMNIKIYIAQSMPSNSILPFSLPLHSTNPAEVAPVSGSANLPAFSIKVADIPESNTQISNENVNLRGVISVPIIETGVIKEVAPVSGSANLPAFSLPTFNEVKISSPLSNSSVPTIVSNSRTVNIVSGSSAIPAFSIPVVTNSTTQITTPNEKKYETPLVSGSSSIPSFSSLLDDSTKNVISAVRL